MVGEITERMLHYPNGAPGTTHVIDNDLLTKITGKGFCEHPCKYISRTHRRPRNRLTYDARRRGYSHLQEARSPIFHHV